jgi:uncharacterized protein YjbI with pentapeptide repeats
MPAFRRLRHQGMATVLRDLDATGRGVTKRYAKAVEQLGSDQAPARFSGLYGLERLAQDNPAHRQAIVNVICAYLRMPFSPTAPGGKREPEAAEGQKEADTQSGTETDGIGGKWRQEKEVRLTAQRILAEHLRDDRPKDKQSTDPPGPRFWNNIHLDLTGATLIDFDLVNGVMADVNFRRATFSRDASFSGAIFRGAARFSGATFSRDARFGGATFNHGAQFGEAIFGRDARFYRAIFTGGAQFGEATFGRDASFSGTIFTGGARFSGAIFRGGAQFGGAVFSGAARFGGVTFTCGAGFRQAAFGGGAWFAKTVFAGDAWFLRAAFNRGVSFGKATFTGDAWFGKAAFTGGAGFDGVVFGGGAWFGEATFGRAASFGEAVFGGDVWFDKVTFGRAASFGEAVFAGDVGFDDATFTGGAWFGEAVFRGGADALHFKQARIFSPGASHVWPTGWRLANNSGDVYTVVRANPNGGS